MDFIAKNIAELSPSMTLAITSQAKALKKQGANDILIVCGGVIPNWCASSTPIGTAVTAVRKRGCSAWWKRTSCCVKPALLPDRDGEGRLRLLA